MFLFLFFFFSFPFFLTNDASFPDIKARKRENSGENKLFARDFLFLKLNLLYRGREKGRRKERSGVFP